MLLVVAFGVVFLTPSKLQDQEVKESKVVKEVANPTIEYFGSLKIKERKCEAICSLKQSKECPEPTPMPTPTPEPIRAVKIQPAPITGPLVEHVEVFFKAGEQYDIDPYLILAIADLESVFGKHIPPGSYNPFGRVCDKRYYKCAIAKDATTERMTYWNDYDSWEEAIYDEAKYLREKYVDLGLDTTCKIARKYAEDVNWCAKIQYKMKIFQQKYPK